MPQKINTLKMVVHYLWAPLINQQISKSWKVCSGLSLFLTIIWWVSQLSFLQQTFFWQMQVLIIFRAFWLLNIVLKSGDWLVNNLSPSCSHFDCALLGSKTVYYWGRLSQWILEDLMLVANLLIVWFFMNILFNYQNLFQIIDDLCLLLAQGLFWSLLVFHLLLLLKARKAAVYGLLLWSSGCLWTDISLKMDQISTSTLVRYLLRFFMMLIPRLDLFYVELFPGFIIFCSYCLFYLSLVCGTFLYLWDKNDLI